MWSPALAVGVITRMEARRKCWYALPLVVTARSLWIGISDDRLVSRRLAKSVCRQSTYCQFSCTVLKHGQWLNHWKPKSMTHLLICVASVIYSASLHQSCNPISLYVECAPVSATIRQKRLELFGRITIDPMFRNILLSGVDQQDVGDLHGHVSIE